MDKQKIILAFLLVSLGILALNNFASAGNTAACVEKGPFLILENQRYALCATANCFTYNQVLYCGCDILNGDSISVPLEFDSQNICDVNEKGKKNGFMVSTFSVPEDTVFPGGKMALYTCPGEGNKGDGGDIAYGSYGQCDGGICFTSTTSLSFPGFDGWDSRWKNHDGYWGTNRIPFPFFDKLLTKEIICACPISTSCFPTGRGSEGYQISGKYDPKSTGVGTTGGCRPEDCEMCSAGEIDPKEECIGNPLARIEQGTIIPVGAPSGTPIILGCLLLDGNVPDTNSCLCQCLEKDTDGNCIWTVIDQSPLVADCSPNP